ARVGALVLRFVVVESRGRADLDRAEHAAVEDADEHLRARDVLLDEDRPVVAARGGRSSREIAARVDDADADRAALVRRLDDARQWPVRERRGRVAAVGGTVVREQAP